MTPTTNQSGAPAGLTLEMEPEKITMFFSALSLPSKKGTTDAFAAIHTRNNVTGGLDLISYTEVVMDTNHPTWMTHVVVDYHFQTIQEVVVRIYHKNPHNPVNNSPQHDFLGEISFHQSALMMSPGSKMIMPLRSGGGTTAGASGARVTIRGEAVAATRDVFTCSFQCNNLTRKNGLGIFGKSDPYIKINRKFDDGSYSVVWQSQHIKGDLNPHYSAQRIHMLPLCNGNLDKDLHVEMFDYDEAGHHQTMGGFKTTARELLASNGREFTLIEPQRQGGFMYKNSGTFKCLNAKIEAHPTLGQYLMGGMEISLTVAIDFTASNGDPTTRKSLHHIAHPGEPLNCYEKAITSVGQVLEPYSKTKQFGVYGFGAKIRQPDGTYGSTQHCFPIYGGESIVDGTSGIIQAYHDSLNVVSLSGPTYFKPLIECGGYLAAEKGCVQEKQTYTVMMILTDGIIDDMQETIQELIRASQAPLSIIIVGIGSEDFSDMSKLDSDGVLLEQGGVKATRDIVQFVPFKKFMQKGAVALAQNILSEIPSQIIKYMEQANIKPNPPASAPPSVDASAPPAWDEPPPY